MNIHIDLLNRKTWYQNLDIACWLDFGAKKLKEINSSLLFLIINEENVSLLVK